jgi:hypothetical protein
VSPLRRCARASSALPARVQPPPSGFALPAVAADAVGEVVQGPAGQRDRGRVGQHGEAPGRGIGFWSICCPTWSLALIDHRPLPMGSDLQDQVGKGSLITRVRFSSPAPTRRPRSAAVSPTWARRCLAVRVGGADGSSRHWAVPLRLDPRRDTRWTIHTKDD